MKYYTLAQAGELVDLSPNTLRKYINLKRIRGIKRGRDWYVTTVTIDKLLMRRRNYGLRSKENP